MAAARTEEAERFFERNAEEIAELAARFVTYITPVDAFAIRRWLKGFAPEDMALALKLLQRVKYYGPADVSAVVHQLTAQIEAEGWAQDNCYFLAFGAPGKSGALILRHLRTALNMRGDRYNNRFLTPSEVVDIYMQDVRLVFTDDFVGTGTHVLTYWGETLAQVLPPHAEIALLLIAGFIPAVQRIEQETGWSLYVGQELADSHRLFHAENALFTGTEKEGLYKYCEMADSENPGGWGNTQATLVFHHGIPNNTIPLIRCTNGRFYPLFKRAF